MDLQLQISGPGVTGKTAQDEFLFGKNPNKKVGLYCIAPAFKQICKLHTRYIAQFLVSIFVHFYPPPHAV